MRVSKHPAAHVGILGICNVLVRVCFTQVAFSDSAVKRTRPYKFLMCKHWPFVLVLHKNSIIGGTGYLAKAEATFCFKNEQTSTVQD